MISGLSSRAGFVVYQADGQSPVQLELTAEAFRYLENIRLQMNVLAKDYANDAAAASGGVAVGDFYHNAGVVRIRLA